MDSKAANTAIRRCIVANNSCDGVKLWNTNSRVENTLIYGRGDGNPQGTPWSAIVISPETQANTRFEIVNVTVDDYLGLSYLMSVQYDYPDVPVHVTIRNTIFCGRGQRLPIFISQATTLVAKHNIFYFPQNDVILTHGELLYNRENIASLGMGNCYGDSLFVRPARGNADEKPGNQRWHKKWCTNGGFGEPSP